MTFRPVSVRDAAASSLVALALVAGCSAGASKSAPGGPAAAPAAAMPMPAESGVLADYSKLVPSEQFPDLRFYRDETRKTGYRRLLFRPVEVWRGADRILTDVPEDDLQFLADSFYQAVRAKLAQSFEIVGEPGPGVLEIQLALTLVADPESNVDFFTTEVPAKDLAPRSGALAPATVAFVRGCALEAEMSEQTGKKPAGKHKRAPRVVRAAIFDVRRGDQSPKGNVSTWEDVRAVFDRWGGVLAERLTALSDGTFKPRLTTQRQ